MAQTDRLGSVPKQAALLAILALLTLALVVVQARPAHAAANKTVQGHGSTAEFVCASSGPGWPAAIDFQAQKSGPYTQKGTVSGYGQVSGSNVYKAFNLTSGTINQNSYSLEGALYYAPYCGFSAPATVAHVTLSGRCGSAVTIYYTDSDGEKGNFLGNVACT
jgi:hypothetical protein